MRDSLFQLEQDLLRLKVQAQQGLSAAQSYDDSPQNNRLLALEQSLILPKQIANSKKTNYWNSQCQVAMQMGTEIAMLPGEYFKETLEQFKRGQEIKIETSVEEFDKYFNVHVKALCEKHIEDSVTISLALDYHQKLANFQHNNDVAWEEVFLSIHILVERLNDLETDTLRERERQRVFFKDIWLEIEHPVIKLCILKDDVQAGMIKGLSMLNGKHRALRWKIKISCKLRCLSSEFFTPKGWEVGFIQKVQSHRWARFYRIDPSTGQTIHAEERLVRCDEDRWFLDTSAIATDPEYPFFKKQSWAAPQNLQDLTVEMSDKPSWVLPYQYKLGSVEFQLGDFRVDDEFRTHLCFKRGDKIYSLWEVGWQIKCLPNDRPEISASYKRFNEPKLRVPKPSNDLFDLLCGGQRIEEKVDQLESISPNK